MVLERYQADPPAATTGGDRDMRERAGRCSPKVYPLPSCPNRLRNRSRWSPWGTASVGGVVCVR